MPNLENIHIDCSIPQELLSSSAEVFYEAFKDKMKFLVHNESKGKIFAKELLSTKYCIYAENNSICVGIASIRYGQYSSRKSTFLIYLRNSGMIRGISAYLAILLLDHKINSDEMRIDNLAVRLSYRGKGIGTAMLGKAYQIAKENKLRKIIVEVINENKQARKLYEREGYMAVKTYHYPVIGQYMGYSSSTILEKEITK